MSAEAQNKIAQIRVLLDELEAILQEPDPVPPTLVTPTAPVVAPATGACVNNVWVEDSATVSLPAVENGRWLYPTEQTPVESAEFDAAPGEYTFVFTTAEGNFAVAEPADASYRLENGNAHYTVTVDALVPQNCEPDPEPETANPQATVVSDTVIDVTWTEVAGATGYLVGRDAAGGESGPWSTTDPAGTTSRRFLYLKPGTAYTFSVKAEPDGALETVQATTQGATPDPEPNAPASPAGLPVLGIGVNGDAGPQDSAHLTRIRALAGPHQMWYRVGFAYSGNDPYQGVVDKLRVLRSHDLKVLARISLGSNPDNVTASQYEYHARRVVQAAKDEGWSPQDIVFEYHNEYLTSETKVQHYYNMAKAAYPVIKSIDTNYKVIGGSQNVYVSGWPNWLDRLYALGFGNYTDGLSWHDYAAQGQYGRTNSMWSVLTKYGQQNKMIWMTETGASTRTSGGSDGGPNSGEGGVSYEGQATRITGLLTYLGRDWPQITHVILYVDLDRPSIGSANPHEAYFGIWENTSSWVRTPKPAVAAITNLYDGN